MPITDPRKTAQVASYIPPALKARMQAIHRRKAWLSISVQIKQALERHIDTLEADAGLTRRAS